MLPAGMRGCSLAAVCPWVGEWLHLLQASSTASVSRTFIFLSPGPEGEKGRTDSATQPGPSTGAAVQTSSL